MLKNGVVKFNDEYFGEFGYTSRYYNMFYRRIVIIRNKKKHILQIIHLHILHVNLQDRPSLQTTKQHRWHYEKSNRNEQGLNLI
jgi:hypothetical protein